MTSRNRFSVRLAASGADLALAALALCVVGGSITVAVSLTPVLGAHPADSDAPAFEVASLKPSEPIAPLRALLFENMANDVSLFGWLPGRGNRVRINGWSAAELIAAAYQVPMREIVGPSRIFDARYVIDALIPSDQPRAKAPEMLRTLLQERLALKAHREVRRTSGYILSVGNGGPKLEEALPFTPTMDPHKLSRIRRGFSGFQLDHGDMAQLANCLAGELHARVEDRTGLKGFYFILIEIPSSEVKDELDQPALFRRALRAYGLDLAAGKIDAPILVIDNLSKTPAPD
jgi:uncharacterized protein (TIGR03435 family)